MLVGTYTYILAFVGVEVKPVTCWRDDERAFTRGVAAAATINVKCKNMLATEIFAFLGLNEKVLNVASAFSISGSTRVCRIDESIPLYIKMATASQPCTHLVV